MVRTVADAERDGVKVKFETEANGENYNIDVVIKNSPESRFKVFAIECKFSEAYYSRTHSGISPKYIELNKVWDDMPNLLKLAKEISPDDNRFTHLHPAQLIKHILGLKEKFGKNKFRLLVNGK